jgi:hypothetical protein
LKEGRLEGGGGKLGKRFYHMLVKNLCYEMIIEWRRYV